MQSGMYLGVIQVIENVELKEHSLIASSDLWDISKSEPVDWVVASAAVWTKCWSSNPGRNGVTSKATEGQNGGRSPEEGVHRIYGDLRTRGDNSGTMQKGDPKRGNEEVNQ